MIKQFKPQLKRHFDFTARPLVMVRESFARLEAGTVRVYAGVSHGAWQADEIVWNERDGRWSSFVPEPREDKYPSDEEGAKAVADIATLRSVVAQMTLEGATLELGDFGFGSEPLLRVESGDYLRASSSLLYEHPPQDYFPETALTWHLYDAVSGELEFGVPHGELGIWPDGSYVLWANAGAEWSAVRVQIGANSWQCGAVYPGPGCPLYVKNQSEAEAVIDAENEADFALCFDPLARAVSASCVLHSDLRTRDGQFDAPAGSLVLAGLRASRNGPQSALWILRADGTARLLAASPTFSDGRCECAKTNHHASDVGQAPDGRLFLLSECNLSVYDSDALTPWQALQPFPANVDGHPGGQTIRFPGGSEINFFTENFGGVSDGEAWYNRLVRRVAGRDASGPSTLWHGPNCAEMYQNALWGVRGEKTGDGARLYLDRIAGGRWARFDGLTRDTLAVSDGATGEDTLVAVEKWQRLRAVGNSLWLFGWRLLAGHAAGQEEPVALVTQGQTLDYAALPYFVRRATPHAETRSLLLCARDASDGIGIANRVVEIVATKTHVCSFWNETISAFVLGQPAFEAMGGDVTKLPAFFVWHAQAGRDGGGVWKAADAAPGRGFYLQTSVDGGAITFDALPDQELPYDPNLWDNLCFDIFDDGSVDGPFVEPGCENAGCVLPKMPIGTKFRVIERLVPDGGAPLMAFQITDASHGGRLSNERDIYPCLWYRVDSDAPRNDLASYNRLAHYGRLIAPDVAAAARVEVVVLVTPQSAPLQASEIPVVARRA